MTKLKKYSLEDLERSFTGLTELEKAAYVGGGNEYYFDRNGKIVSVKANDLDYDQAFCGSNFGINHKIEGELSISSHPWELNPSRTVTEISGGDWDFFKFLADNTNVEWEATMRRYGDIPSGSTSCVIRTINDRGYAPGEYELGAGNNTYIHSHPDNDPSPSIEDRKNTNEMSAEGYEQGVYNPKTGNIRWYE